MLRGPWLSGKRRRDPGRRFWLRLGRWRRSRSFCEFLFDWNHATLFLLDWHHIGLFLLDCSLLDHDRLLFFLDIILVHNLKVIKGLPSRNPYHIILKRLYNLRGIIIFLCLGRLVLFSGLLLITRRKVLR